MAVPQVVAHRLAGMDAVELSRMSTEKVFAFNEAWMAMAAQAFLENQKLALSFLQPYWFPWGAGMGILGKGIAPYRRRAVANARRLGRVRRK